MKKLYKSILIIVLTVIALVIGYTIIRFLRGTHGTRPQDAFSRAVVKDASESATLMSINVNADKNITYYEFINNSWTDEMRNRLATALTENVTLAEGKVCVTLWEENGFGSYSKIFSVYNFYENETGFIMLDGFYRLNISDLFIDSDIWGRPETYKKCFDTITVLEIPIELQQKAEEEGIDWYEIWPDLVEVEVIETDLPGDE